MSETPYDEVPYESQPIPYTAPEQLSLVSQYYGGPAARIDGCRYLEIGCGAGGNLLPLAFYRRDDHFVGIDSSAAALDVARAAANDMGLENLELIEGDLSDPATLADARFDYVLAHGVLSWIAPEHRESLLALVARTLAPNGVGCVSYNTMPGFGPRGMLRDTLLRLSDRDAPLRSRVTQARATAAFLIEQLEPLDHPYAAMVVHEAKRALDATDGYVAHELLATHNHAFWFGELEALARRHELDQIGDNWLYQPAQAPPMEVMQAVCDFTNSDTQRMELLDAVRYRQHRSMLLRRADEGETAKGGADLIERVRVACDGNVKVSAGARAAIIVLARAWPRSVPFGELGDNPELKEELGDLFISGEVELRLRDPVFAHSASSRANAIVRHLSATAGVMCAPTHHTWMPSDEQRAEIAADQITDDPFRTMLGTWGMLEDARAPDRSTPL